jgi:hypothetical protein
LFNSDHYRSCDKLWEGGDEITPETAALLEQARLLTMYVAQLATDSNAGELF